MRTTSFFKNLSISRRLQLVFSIILIVMVLIGTYVYVTFNNIKSLKKISSDVSDINILALSMRKNEKDFMLRDVYREEFFKTKRSKYIDDNAGKIKTVVRMLDSLKKDPRVVGYEMSLTLDSLRVIFTAYEAKVNDYVNITHTKGFLNYGLSGQFRESARDAEALIKQTNNPGLMVHLLLLRRHEKDYQLRKDTTYVDNYEKEFSAMQKAARQSGSSSSVKLRQALDAYRDNFIAYVEMDKKLGLNEDQGVTGELRNAAHEIIPMATSLGTRLKEHCDKEINSSTRGIIIVIVACVLFVFIVLLTIHLSIVRSIKKAQEAVSKIVGGDLTVTITDIPGDEMGHLLQDLLQMTEKLRSTITNINASTVRIYNASNMFSNLSGEVASGANEQAASTEEISSSMEEMAAGIEQNAQNAIETEDIARKASGEIEKVYQSIASTASDLVKVYEKTNVINKIAERTDILAINAAIEASHAEVYGKGFSVVASEVRKLAENTQQAAFEINNILEKSKLDAQTSTNLLREILPDILKTANLVEEIMAASKEQTSGANQINEAILQLSSVVQDNSNTAEQLATIATDMKNESVTLKKLVSFFKI